MRISHKIRYHAFISTGLILFLLVGIVHLPRSVTAATGSGSIGIEGRISAPAPTTAATISFPRDGTTITDLPVTVTGICSTGLLVKLFKNNVFAGSGQCVNGSFSIKIDLFSGLNELVARVYDDLDQAGPDSGVVKVTFPVVGVNTGSKVSLTSSFAKRGANPGEKLTWPITITGGTGPYALSIDWGDGKTGDIKSQEFPGNFNIDHVYDTPGVYNVIIRATDKNGNVAFLQLVAVANGPLSQSTGQPGSGANGSNGGGTNGSGGGINGVDQTKPKVKILWQPAAISIPLIFSTFYLGRKYELFALRKRLQTRDDIR